jgi:hypothetical protein
MAPDSMILLGMILISVVACYISIKEFFKKRKQEKQIEETKKENYDLVQDNNMDNSDVG